MTEIRRGAPRTALIEEIDRNKQRDEISDDPKDRMVSPQVFARGYPRSA